MMFNLSFFISSLVPVAISIDDDYDDPYDDRLGVFLDRYLETYLAVFNGPQEFYRHVRVVFTGKEGAGKTTVCRRLQNKYVNLKLRKPTVGAILHPHWFSVDQHRNSWSHNDDRSSSDVLKTRLGAFFVRLRQREELRSQRVGVQDTTAEHENYVPKSLESTFQRLNEVNAVRDDSRHTDPDVAFISLWDMGGHTSFQASHNVFVSSHGVYLVVFRLPEFLNDRMETYRLKKWIRMIGTYSSGELNTARMMTHHPPLIFIGTFLDELKKMYKHYNKQVEAIRSSILKFPELSSHKFVKFCTVDNSKGRKPIPLRLRQFFRKRFQNHPPQIPPCRDDDKVTQLRECIMELAEHQDQWGRQLPTRWLKLEMDLLKLKENGTTILRLEEVIEMNRKSKVPLDNVEEIKLALQYLHCTRSVIYFPEFDYVINDPQWLADCFGLLITDDQFLPQNDLVLGRDLKNYKTKGELTQKLIDGLLSLKQNQDFLPHKSILMALMEKFGLVVRIMISESNTASERFSETYTIPSKLMELGNIDGVTNEVNGLKRRNLDVSKTLCFIFHDVFVPEELFHRVFATILRTYRTAPLSARHVEDALRRNRPTTNDTTCLYRGFGCFEINDLCRMIVSMHWERSTIAVTLFSPSESKLPPGSGLLVRNTLERILHETLGMSNQQHFQYTHNLHCNFHLSPYDTPVELYSINHAEGGMACKGAECCGIHRLKNSDLSFWAINEGSRNSERPRFSDDVPCLDRRPTPQELGRLAYKVSPSCCFELFLELGLSMPDILHMQHEASSLASVTQITRMFLKWTNTYPNQTFRHIEKALTKVDGSIEILATTSETGWEYENLGDMESNRRLTRQLVVSEIRGLVDNIGKDYFNLFLELGLSVPAIERCEINRDHAVEMFEKLLKIWINTFGHQATIIRVVKAMKFCQMDWYSTAETFCVPVDAEAGF